jgi:hypothetical protein
MVRTWSVLGSCFWGSRLLLGPSALLAPWPRAVLLGCELKPAPLLLVMGRAWVHARRWMGTGAGWCSTAVLRCASLLFSQRESSRRTVLGSLAAVPSRIAVPMRVLAVPGGMLLAVGEPKLLGLPMLWKAPLPPPPPGGVCV